jgi:hypothetical protein
VTPSETLARLLRVGMPDGPSGDEARRLFAELRLTPEEGRAIDMLLARHAGTPLPEPLLVAVASAMVDRDDAPTAAGVLANATSTAALMLRADLSRRAGDVGGAVAQVERVLLRDIDWPGARERHARWRETLGHARPPSRQDTGVTLVAASAEAPFRLLREVARGGAGVVYEAEDRDLGRRVAVKIYHRPEADRGQLLHEARVAVALAGDGIVRVFDADPEHGWLSMEWAKLGALRTRLAARVPTEGDVDDWARPLARALDRVHKAGWVHHDVKPANVLFREPRSPLISDFGTACPVGDPSPPGSLGYVSPERLAGRPSDPRDDVYGFGRVLEDALDAADVASPAVGAWRALAALCTGPDRSRPRDGGELSAIIDETARRQDVGRS